MNILQTGATIILLTMIMYFIMVNVFERQESPLLSEGQINVKASAQQTAEYVGHKVAELAGGIRSTLGINNRLPIEGINTDTSSPITGVNVQPGQPVFDTTALGSAQYNAEAKGLLPQNHELFEKSADFTSDVTNINQFYKNNPELFHKSHTYVPNVADWDQRGQEMINEILQSGGSGGINPSNFEHNFTRL